jgi:hypothetical protein
MANSQAPPSNPSVGARPGTEVQNLVLFYCPNSPACIALANEINDLKPSIRPETCDVSGKKARRLLANNKTAILDGVPALLVVKGPEDGEIFKGRPKIIQWFLEMEEQNSLDDPMVGVPPPPAGAGAGKQIEFAFANEKGGRPDSKRRPVLDKYKDVKAMARKMQEDRARTYGYDDTPSQAKMNRQMGATADSVTTLEETE